MVIMKNQTKMLNVSAFISLSQFITILFESVSIRKSNLEFCTASSTKNSHQNIRYLKKELAFWKKKFHSFIELGLHFDLCENESYSTFVAKAGFFHT